MQNNYNYHKLNSSQLPEKLQLIDSPPRQLFYIGKNPLELLKSPAATIVGTRKPSQYGHHVTERLSRELSQKGVVIISGLALGVDSVAHKACLDAGGKTIAILPCGPEGVYPRSHAYIAHRIIEQGGSLVTEYPVGTQPLRQNFIARNRIVSALGDVVIITEAAEKSGTLHTANFALNQGKTVMAVPGPITSSLSKGTNNLIKTGALPITDISDIFYQLGIDNNLSIKEIIASTPEEHIVLTLLQQGVTDGNQLLSNSKLQPSTFNQTLTMLEINGKVKALSNNHWQII